MPMRHKIFLTSLQANRFKAAVDAAWLADMKQQLGLPADAPSIDRRNGVLVVPPITTGYVEVRDLGALGYVVECDDTVQAMHGRRVRVSGSDVDIVAHDGVAFETLSQAVRDKLMPPDLPPNLRQQLSAGAITEDEAITRFRAMRVEPASPSRPSVPRASLPPTVYWPTQAAMWAMLAFAAVTLLLRHCT